MVSGDTWTSGVREAELGLQGPQLTSSWAWGDLSQFFEVLPGSSPSSSLFFPPPTQPEPWHHVP